MDLIKDFLALTDNGLSPQTFRTWAILPAIGAMLNRKVWTTIRKGAPIYPNLFVLLVGPPGSGKSVAVDAARSLLQTQSQLEIAPSSTSYEMFIHTLSERSKVLGEPASSALFLSEWGTFMRNPEPDFCAMMADIFDCKDYKHAVLSREEDIVKDAFVNICACCTPAWFAEGFPPNSYEQGLPTRFQFVYCDTKPDSAADDFCFDPTPSDPLDDPMINALFPLLSAITDMRGYIPWDAAAASLANKWKRAGMPPMPTDPMLTGYNTRRPLHIAKLCMIVVAARHPERPIIERPDLECAMEMLFAVETNMPIALQFSGGNPYQLRIGQLYNFVERRFAARNAKAVPEWEVRQHVSKLVAPNMVSVLIDQAVASKRLNIISGTKSPLREFKPGMVAR